MTDEQIEIQKQQIIELINYCRARDRQVKGFGHTCLDDIAAKQKIPQEIKEAIKILIDNPEKEIKINFKKNTIAKKE